VNKNFRRSVILSAFSIVCIPLSAFNQSATQKPTDLVSKVAELTVKIEGQKAQNASLAQKLQEIQSDSAKEYANVEEKVVAAAKNVKDLSAAVEEDEKMLATLEKALSSSSTAISKKESGGKTASKKPHATAVTNEGAVALKKQNAEAAEKKVEQAKSDSIARATKSDKELSALRDSLAALDRSITHVKRQMDSIAALSGAIKKDSVSEWKKHDDAFKTAATRLQETRQAVVMGDSLVTLRTSELNALRKDSSDTFSTFARQGQKREDNSRRLDSLSRALQIEKTGLYQMQEKIELDSIIKAQTDEILEMQKTGAATEKIEEKQRSIESNKNKRNDLLRDKKLTAMVAREAKTSREALNAKINSRVTVINHTLDSIAKTQEQISRDNVFQEKEYREKSRAINKKIDSLNRFITTASREAINRNAQLPKAIKDSSEAAIKRNEKAQEYGKKQPPLAAALKEKTERHKSLKGERDALDKKIQARDAAAREELSTAGKAIGTAQKAKDGALGEYNAAAAKEQKVREDSISVAASQQDSVKQALLSIEVKKEELAVKKGRHNELVSQLKKAKDDHAFLLREQKQQQVANNKKLSEARLKLTEGERTLKDLETQQADLKKRIGGKQ
jgi:hypothetical protein